MMKEWTCKKCGSVERDDLDLEIFWCRSCQRLSRTNAPVGLVERFFEWLNGISFWWPFGFIVGTGLFGLFTEFHKIWLCSVTITWAVLFANAVYLWRRGKILEEIGDKVNEALQEKIEEVGKRLLEGGDPDRGDDFSSFLKRPFDN